MAWVDGNFRHRIPLQNGIVRTALCLAAWLLLGLPGQPSADAEDFAVDMKQITFGPKNHFFGYKSANELLDLSRAGASVAL